jgi:predicted thioesterase
MEAMELNQWFQPGQQEEFRFVVSDHHTAIHLGSGAARVLATPWMIAMMEGTAHRLLARHLPAGQSSVGVVVNVRHLAATPVGEEVRVQAEVVSVDGLRVNFRVRAWDAHELIGEGEHQRAVIDEARFFKRVLAKGEGA